MQHQFVAVSRHAFGQRCALNDMCCMVGVVGSSGALSGGSKRATALALKTDEYLAIGQLLALNCTYWWGNNVDTEGNSLGCSKA